MPIVLVLSWWRHQMETFCALLALCEGNQPITRGFPSQMPVIRSFDVFFDLRLNKLSNKHSGRRWFETPSRTLPGGIMVPVPGGSQTRQRAGIIRDATCGSTRITGCRYHPTRESTVHILIITMNSLRETPISYYDNNSFAQTYQIISLEHHCFTVDTKMFIWADASLWFDVMILLRIYIKHIYICVWFIAYYRQYLHFYW